MRRSLGVVLAALALLASAPSAAAEVIDGERAKKFIGRITALGQRPAGSYHELQTARIVASTLADLGYAVERQRFVLPNGRYSRNVIGRTPGPTRVVIVAHMDGVYGTVAANDNGSGVGGMIEIARVLKGKPGLLVAALGAEERVVTGSRFHLGSLHLVRSMTAAERDAVVLAVSLDMIGVGWVLNVRGLESNPNRSARRLLYWARQLGFKASYLQDSGQSDHAEMTRAGMRAAWIEWRWDSCWHQPCDRLGRVDPVKLQKAARLAMVAARAALG